MFHAWFIHPLEKASNKWWKMICYKSVDRVSLELSRFITALNRFYRYLNNLKWTSHVMKYFRYSIVVKKRCIDLCSWFLKWKLNFVIQIFARKLVANYSNKNLHFNEKYFNNKAMLVRHWMWEYLRKCWNSLKRQNNSIVLLTHH